jgi:hypothetical protein
MSKKKSGINYSKTAPARARRASALQMKEAQLKSGKKVTKGKNGTLVPLEDKDIVRIKTEIKTLKERI